MLKKLSMIIFFFPSAATSPSSAVLQHNFLCFPGQPPISAHLGPSQLVSLSHSAARATARCPRRAAVTSKVTCSCSAVCTLQDMTQTAQIWLRCCHMLPQCPVLPLKYHGISTTPKSPNSITKHRNETWSLFTRWGYQVHSHYLDRVCWYELNHPATLLLTLVALLNSSVALASLGFARMSCGTTGNESMCVAQNEYKII